MGACVVSPDPFDAGIHAEVLPVDLKRNLNDTKGNQR
jgi:hypothetical protein